MSFNPVDIISLIFIYVVAITIHEYSHAAASNALGDPTARHEGRLTLNPVAHIDPLTTLALPILLILVGIPVIFGAALQVPFNPYMFRYGKKGGALGALAGPEGQYFVAIIAALIIRLAPSLLTAGAALLMSMIRVN